MNPYTKGMTPELVRKYNISTPYYTSYPALSAWRKDAGHQDMVSALNSVALPESRLPMLLYVHFPFCAKQCYYCICNSVISTKHENFRNMLGYLQKEIGLIEEVFSKAAARPEIDMIHLGGGTPNLMSEAEFSSMMSDLGRLADFRSLREVALEIDVRTVSPKKIEFYAEVGVTRLSLGIQDFEPAVQKAINREQSLELVQRALSDRVRKLYRGLNFDIIYGLPLQTEESFRRTIQAVLRLSPDRITLLKYGHVPDRKAHQRFIRQEDIPDIVASENFFRDAMDVLMANGYVYVGLNHFAKSGDEMAQARKEGGLWRNFIGYTWGGPHDLLGIGPTSASSLDGYYIENVHDLKRYSAALSRGEFPVFRAYQLDPDEMIRREIINALICARPVVFREMEEKYGVDIKKSFVGSLASLRVLAEDGLVEVTDDAILVTSLGELFVRHICHAFDRHVDGAAVAVGSRFK